MKINTAPRSDQYNADDFVAGTAKTFTIANVTEGTAEGARHDVHLAGEDRVWRPPVTILRLLIEAWGDESDNWIGKRVTLYRDAKVRFGNETPGGIRVSHMSHLPGGKRMSVALTAARGRRALTHVDPLPDEPPPPQQQTPKPPTAQGVIKAFESIGVTLQQLELKVGADHEKWTAEDVAELAAVGRRIKDGETTTFEEFEQPAEPEPQQGELA